MSFKVWMHKISGNKISDAAYELLGDTDKTYYTPIGVEEEERVEEWGPLEEDGHW